MTPLEVGYLMLYDHGDECVDVTGGWNGNVLINDGFSVNKMIKHSNYFSASYNNREDIPYYYIETTNKIRLEGYVSINARTTFTGNKPLRNNILRICADSSPAVNGVPNIINSIDNTNSYDDMLSATIPKSITDSYIWLALFYVGLNLQLQMR